MSAVIVSVNVHVDAHTPLRLCRASNDGRLYLEVGDTSTNVALFLDSSALARVFAVLNRADDVLSGSMFQAAA
ncbi:hypothetical protein [Dactylosporangium sp. NPDC051541]|uniref:hypothetical protein n=1 Tax=Dactylosporangium sp. NPDC051541 TaxID=3363977 RepID=UPI00378D6663